MVIIRTSATEVSIQAVSPEFGVHFSSVFASQAGGVSAAGAAAAAGASAGAWAWTDVAAKNGAAIKMATISPKMRAASPPRVGLLIMLFAPVRRRLLRS
jgi:hypothetical protein